MPIIDAGWAFPLLAVANLQIASVNMNGSVRQLKIAFLAALMLMASATVFAPEARAQRPPSFQVTPSRLCPENFNHPFYPNQPAPGVWVDIRFNHHDLGDLSSPEQAIVAVAISPHVTYDTRFTVTKQRPLGRMFLDQRFQRSAGEGPGALVATLEIYEGVMEDYTPPYTRGKLYGRSEIRWRGTKITAATPVGALPNPAAVMQGVPTEVAVTVQFEGCTHWVSGGAWVDFQQGSSSLMTLPVRGEITDKNFRQAVGGSFTVRAKGSAIIEAAKQRFPGEDLSQINPRAFIVALGGTSGWSWADRKSWNFPTLLSMSPKPQHALGPIAPQPRVGGTQTEPDRRMATSPQALAPSTAASAPAVSGERALMEKPAVVTGNAPRAEVPPRFMPSNVPSVSEKFRVGYDRAGSDYKSALVASAQDCQKTCNGEAACKAWTWERSQSNQATGICRLKSAVLGETANARVTSGVK